MRFLVLGGTAWLGGQVATAALARGHEVSCLARGTSGSPPDGAALVRADRDDAEAYDLVGRTDWDVVVDVARQPGHVRRATEALHDRCGRYVFVSSLNVYADHATPGADESAALLPPLGGDVMENMETYGEAKVACEQHVLGAFGQDRVLVARAGLIGGPGDVSGRTGYWPLRLARPASGDGQVLVPDIGDHATQVLDVRDLAAWLVDAGASGTAGAFNATGETVPFAAHLDAARTVADHHGALVTAPEDWLTEHDVQPWMGPRSLPLWLPEPEYAGFADRDNSAARAAGLTLRPLEETLADVLEWELAEGADRSRGAGLTRAEEGELLEDYAQEQPRDPRRRSTAP
ncbi:MAG TPA: NAD-dependent epimerase/dehydratase family protein [Segeticoccus sp.]|uniref:NAD-dependent epimerase/dehydratase family protein n=1 Tax=Segeticoccus sp. TaxID=2706531 RepID=UPI002D7E5213|nr:NAD-dependent epimerase/dehydratase family protein [Segeticoccus sp.]HET8601442.1 NAD-dependent epimerase/dehydratase family protein [Segeticoccus sp.]